MNEPISNIWKIANTIKEDELCSDEAEKARDERAEGLVEFKKMKKSAVFMNSLKTMLPESRQEVEEEKTSTLS